MKKTASPRSLLKRSFIVTALNPKSIAFFVAFLPQFIDPLKPAVPQLTLLGGTFLALATLNAALYALFAGRLGEHMRKENVRKWFHRCGGSALIGRRHIYRRFAANGVIEQSLLTTPRGAVV